MAFQTIEFTADDGLAILRLDRPQSLNAFTIEMLDEMRLAISGLVAGEARALLLCGNGRGFCSGMNLYEGRPEPGGSDIGLVLETHLNPLLEQLLRLPIPIVVAVRGPAAGAGCSLALAGDFVIASETAFFLQAFVNIGLVPDMGASWILPRLIGKARATEMMLLGERLPARRALDWGMIYDVVEDAQLDEAAVALARRLAAGPTRAYDLARQTILASLQSSLGDALERERANQRIAGLTADCIEGVAAFVEQRPARFRGR